MNNNATLFLSGGNLRAGFWPDCGMLGISLQHCGQEVLRRIDDLDAARRKGSTAGIPLLYPWANRIATLRYSAAGRDVEWDPGSPLLHFDERGLPMHGVPWGQLKWGVVEVKQNSLLARLHWNQPELLAVFPYPHTVEIEANVSSDSLTLRTTILADAGSPVPVSFGFHPYFGIPNLPRAQWRLQMPTMRKLLLDSRGIPRGQEEPFGPFDDLLNNANFDDGFAVMSEGVSFTLSGAGRVLTVSFLDGFTHAQVFAPLGKEFIALEPMTAPTNALVSGEGLRILASGGQFRASYRISIRSID